MEALALKARAERETLQILNPFLAVLRSPERITIPVETLSGALAHFIGSLEDDRLDSFLQDVIASPSLWKALTTRQIEAAVRPAPATKVSALRPQVKDGWIIRNRLSKASQAWLKEVFKSVTKSGITTNSVVVLVGLLQGLDDVEDIDWGQPRVELEEEIVLALADAFEKNNCNALDLFCSAANHVDFARLRALDLRQAVPRLNVELFTALGFPPPPAPASFNANHLDGDHVSLVSRGLAACFIALSEGGTQRQRYAWEELTVFVQRMYADCATKLQDDIGDQEPRKGSNEWDRQKAALHAFITVAWPGVVVMLNPHRHASRKQSAELSTLIVLTLGRFASLTRSEGMMDGYEKLLNGSLDVLAAEGGPRTARSMFHQLQGEKETPDLAAFELLVSEQLIHLLDAPTIRDRVVPLAAKYIGTSENRSAFEASNGFLLALLEVASQSLDRDSTQASFVESMVKICSHGFLREAQEESVTTDQLLPAYTQVVAAASRYDTALVHYCLDALDAATFDSKEYNHTIDMIRIACIPFIPEPQMSAYLDKIAFIILTAPQGSEKRIDLAGAAFKVVMNDIPDESKQVGIDWWLKHRRVFQVQKEARAKL